MNAQAGGKCDPEAFRIYCAGVFGVILQRTLILEL